MADQEVRDFFLQVSRGKVPGHTVKIIPGHNPSQSIASGFVDIAEFGDLTYLTAGETMNVVSTSPSDAAGGIGLRTLTIEGVDDEGTHIEELVTLNGTSDVLTEKAYYRINDMHGEGGGSTGWNVGNITAKASGGGSTQAEMDAEESHSQDSHYTVPLGFTLYIFTTELNCAKQTGGNAPDVEFKYYARNRGAGHAWVQFFDKRLDAADNNELDVIFKFPLRCPERTDIRARADTDQNSTETRTRVNALLVDNSFEAAFHH